MMIHTFWLNIHCVHDINDHGYSVGIHIGGPQRTIADKCVVSSWKAHFNHR